MNSEYGQNVSQQKSLQELKQMNQPNSKESTQNTPMTPIVIQCPLPQALTKLAQQAEGISWDLENIRQTLPGLKTPIDLTATQKALEKIVSLLEQAGKKNEKRTCKWLKWLPDFDFLTPVKWLALLLIAAASGAGGVVWRGDDHQQYPQPVSLTPGLRVGLSGLAAAGSLLDDDSEDAEEKRRRMEAKMEGENIGVLLGLAAGAAIALTQNEEQQNDEQQTML